MHLGQVVAPLLLLLCALGQQLFELRGGGDGRDSRDRLLGEDGRHAWERLCGEKGEKTTGTQAGCVRWTAMRDLWTGHGTAVLW